MWIMKFSSPSLTIPLVYLAITVSNIRGSDVQSAHLRSKRANVDAGMLGTGDRIINGKEQAWKKHPWVVYLSICAMREGDEVCSMCGGAILSPKTILTAKHCVMDPAMNPQNCDGTVRYGTNNKKKGGSKSKFKCQKNTIVHDTLDVSVIELDEPMNKTKADFKVIRIPKIEDQAPKVGSDAFVIGWGKACDDETCQTQDRFPKILQGVKIKIRPDKDCQIPRSEFKPGKEFCAGGRNEQGKLKDSCSGDSGGPVECKLSKKGAKAGSGDQTVLCGVVSRGPSEPNCGKAPGIYTKIANDDMIEWLTQQGNAVKTTLGNKLGKKNGGKKNRNHTEEANCFILHGGPLIVLAILNIVVFHGVMPNLF